MGRHLTLDIEYFEVAVGRSDRRAEHLAFVGPGKRYTHRLAHRVSALCRHMSISAVARMTGLAWRTVKAMDRDHLQATLPALHPRDIAGVRHLGVDEVARAKGHDDVTVVYDLDTGDLLWVGEGKSADSFGVFLAALSQETAAGIQAVAMDMGLAFQSAVHAHLPEATLVFDRFHVMKLYSDMIRTVRRAEFRKADAEGKQVIKGSLYLLLGNRQRLDESGIARLEALLRANQTLSTVLHPQGATASVVERPGRGGDAAGLGSVVCTGTGHAHHAAAPLCQDAAASRRRHLHLRAIQAHHCPHRSRKRRHRHDP